MSEQAAKRPLAFHVIAKPVGPICNLECRYCFYLEKTKLYPGENGLADWSMPEDVLESFIRQYIEAQEVQVVNFAWQGGEPTLLGLDFFTRVVGLQKRYSGGKRIENGLQTNGVLLDDRWCEFLAGSEFLVGLSVDGPPELHDNYRVDRGGGPTSAGVMKAISLLKKHAVEFNTLTVVQRHNADKPLEVYRFLKENGSGFLQFIPGVARCAQDAAPDGLVLVAPECGAPAKVTEWSVRPLQYGNFLCAIFDEWVRRDVGRCFVQIFDVALESWCGMEPGLCVFRRTCGEAMAIEHNGDLYSCDHYVYPANRLGNVVGQSLTSMAASAQQREFGENKLNALPRCCRECEVLFACNGECPKNRFVTAPGGEDGLNYLCAGLRRFFNHVDPFMRFMAQELRERRPPANVMSWVREQDMLKRRGGAPGRNDPCPCGSGRKYKKCCGAIQ